MTDDTEDEVDAALADLLADGMIERKVEDGVEYFRLTDKGKEQAERVKETYPDAFLEIIARL